MKNKIKCYLVCPVRHVSEQQKQEMDRYVEILEKDFNREFHYPPRDVDQNQSEEHICEQHREAMELCDEVHFWWDYKSTGSHFDFGMAYMIKSLRNISYVLANVDDNPITDQKSYTNLLVRDSIPIYKVLKITKVKWNRFMSEKLVLASA